MAKDDYHVLVYKILSYLYKRLKGKDKLNPEEYIVPMSKDFPINEEYYDYILNHMLEEGLIEGISFIKLWGGAKLLDGLEYIQITPAGIEYLSENNMMKKVAEALGDIVGIVGNML